MMDMQREVVDQTMREFKERGFDISDEEILEVKEHCLRKMQVAWKTDEYFKLLFPDALKEYVYRKLVNTISVLCMMEVEDVQCMFKEPMR